jgi:hypothetical protein
MTTSPEVPPQPPASPAQPKMESMAMLSLIWSLIVVFLSFTSRSFGDSNLARIGFAVSSMVVAAGGIIAGALAIQKIRLSQGRLKGQGPAVAGIIIGSLYIVLVLLGIAIALVFAHTRSAQPAGPQ